MIEEAVEREDVDPSRIALISDIFKTLSKTIKTFGVYPKDNPIYQKFASELTQKFDAFFEIDEDLLLNVEQFSLLYKGKEVFYSTEKTDNIAISLYIDGIREICFHKGVSLDEIIDFINILRVAPKEENVEDDIVTLLWEKNLEHVSYFVPEEVDEADISIEEDLISEGSSETATTASGATYSDLTIRPAALDLKEVEPVIDNEVTAIKHEAEHMDRDYLLSSAVELFFELISSEKDLSAFVEYVKNIKGIVDIKIEEKEILGVIEILKRLSSFSESLTVPEQKDVVSNVVNKIGSIENMKILFKATTDTNILSEYLSLLSKDSIPNMIEILGELEDRKMRRFLCNILAGLAPQNMNAFEQGLKDSRWFLVRNIVMILGMTKDVKIVKLIGKITKHPEIKVRREAIRALENIHSSETKNILMTFLNDSDPTTRINALIASRRYGGKDLFSLLKEFILREDFKERSFTEKREILDALGEIGKEEAFPVLSAIFKKKGFFKREENLELRACAAYGLGHVGTPEAISLLEKEVNSKKGILREACRTALKGAAKR